MKKKEVETRFRLSLVITLICCLWIFTVPVQELSACTGIRIMSKDGSVIYARTLEFSPAMYFSNIIIPRGIEFTAVTPTGFNGLKWRSKYGLVGMDQLGHPLLTDGVNEAGLGAGLFYHPGFANYQKFEAENKGRTLSPYDLVTWILSQFASVDDVKSSLDKVTVVAVKSPMWGFVSPLHYIVHDKSGKCIVIEFLKGKMTVYDNPIGIITNSPAFDWHMENLRNYINLQPVDVSQRDIMGVKAVPFGVGSGMHGLPGDFTPASRFVRAAYLTAQSPQEDTAFKGVRQAFRILNQFDIPKGAQRNIADETKAMYGETVWTTAADLANGRYYFHTINNRRIRFIDLKKVNLTGSKIQTIVLKEDREDLLDVTPGSSK